MTVRFGSRPASVPAYTRQFQTLGLTASLLKVDTGKLPEVEPAGAIVPEIFEALGRMAGAAVPADREEPASWQEQLADMPTDAEAMAQADPANRDLALNHALETAYGAGKDVQFGDMAERIYAKNEADLEAFESDWRNLKTSALDNLAPSWKPIAEAEFDRRRALYVPRIAANIRTRIEDETNAGLRTAADTYTARAATAAHDDDAAELAQTLRRFEAAISARTDLAPEEKAKARADFQSGVATQVALGRFDRALKEKGLEGAARFAEDLAQGRAGGGDKLGETERAPIARALQAHLDDAREADAAAKAAATTSAKVESAKRLVAVERSIGEHTYGFADLERDTQAGMFDGHPDAASRLSKSIEEARKDRQDKTEAAARGAEAVAGGTPLDPADPEHVSAIDAWWDAHPDKGPAGAIEAARRTGILPGPARDAIADGLFYGTPEKRAEQAGALVDLIKAAPTAAETLPAQLRQEATRIVKRIDQGHDPESATEGTDKALEGVSPELMGGAGNDRPAGDEGGTGGLEDDNDDEGRYWEEQSARQPDRGMSLEEKVRRDFGMDPDADRATLLPNPHWSWDPRKWTAPQLVYELVKAVAQPRHVLDGGELTEKEVTEAALAIGGSGAVAAKAPRGALASQALQRSSAVRSALLRQWKEAFISTPDVNALAARVEMRTPEGFFGREEIAKIASGLQGRFRAAEIDDARIVMRGSSVTGRKFNRDTGKYDGPAFGPRSDHDYAVVSAKLFAKAEELAKEFERPDLKIMGGTRTSPVPADVLRDLRLENLLPKTAGGKARKSSLVIYRDMGSLEKRGPYIPLD
jgi:hypothetical protein